MNRSHLLAAALLVLLSLSGCATSTAVLRATPTAMRTTRPRPTYPPCDGATQWKPPAGNIALGALAMVSADEGWATGAVNPDHSSSFFTGSLPSAAILYHLVNGQWQRLPQTFAGAEFQSLSMDSPSDGWAALGSPVNGSTHALVLHYTNGVWQPADVPALDAFQLPPAYGCGIGVQVQMVGPQAGWMFATENLGSNVPRSLVLRYESGAWTLIPEPPAAATVELGPLVAASADEAWMLGSDPNATTLTTLVYHYVNGGWGSTPQTFPFAASLTMLSADDGWAAGYTDANQAMVRHYDGVKWAQVATPAAWSAQEVLPVGPVFAIAPGVIWEVTQVTTATFTSGMGLGLWQYADTNWSPVAWPFQDVVPATIAAGTTREEWGMGDIYHQEGCPPAFVTDVRQGVFLHEVNGTWTREDLP